MRLSKVREAAERNLEHISKGDRLPPGIQITQITHNGLNDLLEVRDAWLSLQANMGNVLVCDGCGRLWADDADSDDESCETPDCGRFKQRMEWASAQQIEDRDTMLLQHSAALSAKLEAVRLLARDAILADSFPLKGDVSPMTALLAIADAVKEPTT